jgi:hypothetical protein
MAPKFRKPTIYIGTICLCVLMPVVWNLIGRDRLSLGELLTAQKVSFAVGAIALFAWELKARLDSGAPVLALIGGAVLVTASFGATSRANKLPFDLQAYVRAAESIAAGTNPYVSRKGGYLYPPLLAESIYVLRTPVDKFASMMTASSKHAKKSDAAPIAALWYGFELLAAVLVYACSYKLARRLGADELLATSLPLVLLLANHAYWRTLQNGQLNLLLATVFLVAILCAARRQFASGLAVAVGAHLKVYPIFLLGAWTLSGRWKITAYALLCFAVIFALQLALFDPSLWQNYVHFAARAPQQVRAESLATVSVVSFTFGNGKAIKSGTIPGYITAIVYATILLVMAVRFLQREKIWRSRHRELESAAVGSAEDRFRIMGHANDAVVLPLLISPIVWNHHYVVLIPALIWSTLLLGPSRARSWLPVAALLFPYFVQPFIYIYYVGIWLWLYETSPVAIWAAVTGGDRLVNAQLQPAG